MSFIINPSTGGGSTAPGGADTNVQYNNAGAFGGASDVLYSSSFQGLFANKIKSIGTNSLNLLGIEDTGSGIGGGVTMTGGEANSASGFSGSATVNSGSVLNGVGAGNVGLNGGVSFVAGIAGGNIVLRPGSGGIGAAASTIRLRAENGSNVVQVTGNATTGAQLGFYGVTPVIRATVAGAASVFVAGAGVAVQDVSTFDGYTIQQITKALRNIGILT